MSPIKNNSPKPSGRASAGAISNGARIGVVGNGSMGRRRIKHSQMYGYTDITGWDIRSDRRKEVESKFGIQTVKSQKDFENSKFDALFICVPPAEHYYYMKLAVKNGWNFMVENPVWHKVKGLDVLQREVKKKKLVANVSCNVRFLKATQRIKQLVRDDVIGPILSGVAEVGEYLPDWHPYEPYTDYYPSKKEMGGGIDAMCDLDWLVDIFGDIRRMNCVYSKKSSLKINTYDIIDFILEFKLGPQIVLHTDMLQSPYGRAVKLISERGVIVWEYKEQIVKYYDRRTKKWTKFDESGSRVNFDNNITTTWAEQMYMDDSFHFFKCLKGEAKPLNTIESNSKLLKQLLKAIDYA
ncbi:MAG: putative dehydrogenase [Parcubacteria group bacterium Gr01-1014_8]|nr:MAG: putative dehydrogenase [Parcubacteria group bacterium Gr01-1014_8]